MHNYAHFQDKNEVFRVISVIKDLTYLVRNLSKLSMKNYILNFNMIKSFGINNTRTGKELFVLFLLDESFFHQVGLKLTLMGLLGDILVLLLVEVVFVRVCMGNLLELFMLFLKFRLLWLLSFMGYMLWRKSKDGLTNVWLECDSALVCAAFTTSTNVPSMLRNQ